MIYFSNTAYQNGFGKALHKSVCGQTKAEREAIKQGAIVLYDCGRFAGSSAPQGYYKCTLRQIIYSKGYWQPRVPKPEIIQQYSKGEYTFI